MGWLIALIVVLLLAVLPLGISASYDADGAVVRIIFGPARIKVFPRKKKEKQEEKEEPAQPQTEEEIPAVDQPEAPAEPVEQVQPEEKPVEDAPAKGGKLSDFLPLVRLGLDFLGDFRRKLRIRVLKLHIVLAGDDPADLGILYGRAWAALGNLWPRLERLFVIRKRDVEVGCDFTADDTVVSGQMDISITLGRLLALLVCYGIRTLKVYLKIRKNVKAVQSNEQECS